MKKSPASALVADSQELFSYALVELLKSNFGFAKISSVSTFDAAKKSLSGTPAISFAAFDVALAGMEGLAGVAALRVSHPELRLAVVAGSTRREDILRALSVGVHGYIPRSLSIAEAVRAMRTIMEGNIYVPSALSEVMNGGVGLGIGRASVSGGAIEGTHEAGLTSRQLEVMKLIAAGMSNKQIAQQLNLAEGTVKAHVNAVFKALSVHDRASVAAVATQIGGGD